MPIQNTAKILRVKNVSNPNQNKKLDCWYHISQSTKVWKAMFFSSMVSVLMSTMIPIAYFPCRDLAG